MNHFVKTERLNTFYFKSMAEFFEYKEVAKSRMTKNDAGLLHRIGTSQLQNGTEWLGPTNISGNDVVEHAIVGDSDLYQNYLIPKISQLNVDGQVFDIEQTVSVSRRVRKRGDSGDEIDIHKVYSGNLDKAWSYTERETFDSKHNLITLVIDLHGNWDQDVSQSLWMAASACKIVDQILKTGKSIRIVVVACHNYGFPRGMAIETSIGIEVKSYNQPMSIERVAAMCHFGFMRSVLFSCNFAQQEQEPNAGLGYYHEMRDGNIPFHIQEEIKGGHTKLIVLRKSMNKYQAIENLKSVYQQMREV